jgi:hypothetical protein
MMAATLNRCRKQDWWVEWDYCCTFDNAGPFTLRGALRYLEKNAKRIEAGTTGSTEKLQRIWIKT